MKINVKRSDEGYIQYIDLGYGVEIVTGDCDKPYTMILGCDYFEQGLNLEIIENMISALNVCKKEILSLDKEPEILDSGFEFGVRVCNHPNESDGHCPECYGSGYIVDNSDQTVTWFKKLFSHYISKMKHHGLI